jgi:beta-lactamase regulating signal transducer with metallopeptidase domain
MIGTVVAAALWALVASLLLSLVVGGLVAGTIALTRPAAATRQALWSLALAAAGFAPVAILAVMLVRGSLAGAAGDTAPLPSGRAAHLTAAGAPQHQAISAHEASASSSPAKARVLRVPGPPDVAPLAARGIVFVWALGALIGLVGLGRSLVRVRGLKGRSSPLDGALATELPWLTTIAGREIYLRLSYETETPIAVGFRRPVILLPTDMATADGLTSIEPLIMHEYAHLAHYDDWSNLAQRATERLFWFNPLVWILGRRIALEREVAADEAVVARTHDAKRYATTLWRMAQEMRMPEHVVVAPGAMLTRKQISVRIERLLDEHPVGHRYVGAAALAIAIVAASGVAGLAASAPPIVIAQAEAPVAEQRTQAAPLAHTATAEPAAPAAPPAPAAPAAPAIAAQAASARAPRVVANASNNASSWENLGERIADDVQRKLGNVVPGHGVVAHSDTGAPLTRDLIRHCIGCDFTRRDLHGLDLSNISLVGDDFTRANLTGVNFSHSTLEGDDFTRADMSHANLHSTKLMGVDFSHAILDGSDLSNASLTGVDLSSASLNHANTTDLRMVGSQLP